MDVVKLSIRRKIMLKLLLFGELNEFSRYLMNVLVSALIIESRAIYVEFLFA